jgi:hypothetical protein
MTKFAAVLKHLEQERIRLTSQIDQVGKGLAALTGRSMIRKRRLSATAIARIRDAQKARWAKWRKARQR